MAHEPRYRSWGGPLLYFEMYSFWFFFNLKFYTFVCISVIFKLLTSSSGLMGGNWARSHRTSLARTVPVLNLKMTVLGVLLSFASSRAMVSSVFVSDSVSVCGTRPAGCSYMYRCRNVRKQNTPVLPIPGTSGLKKEHLR